MSGALKSIGYAYASSAMAARLNASRKGCYYVETKREEASASALCLYGPYATLEAAEVKAATMPEAWSRYTKRAA